jgi:hypothetical protein
LRSVIPGEWDKVDAFKDDSGKIRMGLVPPELMRAAGRALTYGAAKYADHQFRNGKGITIHRAADALLRHLFAYLDGEDKDPVETTPPGSGLCHLDHVAACVAFLCVAHERKEEALDSELDDRWRTVQGRRKEAK